MIKIEDCKFTNEWDALGWKNYINSQGENTYAGGYKWEDTVMTKINQCTATISRHSMRGGADTIMVHPDNSELITNLEYYQYDKCKLGGRYDVIITTKVSPNKIFVGRDEYFNLTHVSKFLGDEEASNLEPYCVPIEEVYTTKEAVAEYKRGLMGCVKILNYEQENITV